MDSNDAENSEPSLRETDVVPVYISLKVEPNENRASTVLIQKEHQSDNDEEPLLKKRRPNASNKNVEQPSKKLGRSKLNKNVRTEHDSTMEMVQPPQQQPKKRHRRTAVPAKTDQKENDLGAADSGVADADATASDRTINRVESMRKRDNRHEFLVTWTTGDSAAEWIARDIMATKYPQHLIAYFERITQFTLTTSTTALTSIQ